MEQFLQNLTSLVSSANGFIWGVYFLIPLLCGTGLFFTIRLGGVQFTKFGAGWKRLFGNFSLSGKEAGKHGMSSFQAVATAIAAQVGTGNLVGAMTALIMGGPGAIFWMWLAALAGMATNFAEASIAQIYKTKDDSGQTVGGPAYYISEGLKNKVGDGFAKFLAGFFAIAIILALGFMGNMVQANSISDAFQNAFHIPTWITGAVLAVIAGTIFMGGVKRIASVTEKVVPIMAIVYIVVGLVVVIINAAQIPEMFAMIFKGAFNPKAVWGGALGFGMGRAVRYGVARGLFSNEAGMGSTPHAHAIAKVDHPAEQGFVAMIGVFIDTFVILNLTALVIITTQSLSLRDASGVGYTGAALSQVAFSTLYHKGGDIFIAICMLFFAFSTIIGWYFFGAANIRYLFGNKAIKPYSFLVALCVFAGSLAEVNLVWNMADLFNSLMVLPNIIGLFALTKIIVGLKEDYYHNFKKNKR